MQHRSFGFCKYNVLERVIRFDLFLCFGILFEALFDARAEKHSRIGLEREKRKSVPRMGFDAKKEEHKCRS